MPKKNAGFEKRQERKKRKEKAIVANRGERVTSVPHGNRDVSLVQIADPNIEIPVLVSNSPTLRKKNPSRLPPVLWAAWDPVPIGEKIICLQMHPNDKRRTAQRTKRLGRQKCQKAFSNFVKLKSSKSYLATWSKIKKPFCRGGPG